MITFGVLLQNQKQGSGPGHQQGEDANNLEEPLPSVTKNSLPKGKVGGMGLDMVPRDHTTHPSKAMDAPTVPLA